MNKLGIFVVFAVFTHSALGRFAIMPILRFDPLPNQGQNFQQQQNLPGRQTTQATLTSGTRGPEIAPSSTTEAPEISACIRNCPVTSEYNPVCGSNKITYDNLGRLSCAQACGVDVTMLWKSRCTVPDQF